MSLIIKKGVVSKMRLVKEFTAKTVEEAMQLAQEEFAVAAEKITFNVIEEPKKGLFGKTKGDAVVEASYEETKADLARRYIISVLNDMGLQNISITDEEIENGIRFEVSADGFEDLIGKKGELLDALQYLASLSCNKIDRDYYRISIDSCGFREKRKQHLENLTRKICENVKKNGRTSALEPMNPYERRIVHATVSEIEGVVSKSVGEEPYRKVLISSTEKRERRNDDRRGDRSNGRRNGGRRNKQPKSFDISTSFEKDYKKPKPEDTLELGSGLYSKIEF